MLLLVDFAGPMRDRLQAQAALSIVCGVFVCLGTLASNSDVGAAVAMAIVAFAVLFAGVVSSVLASATTSLLLAFILPVSLAGPASEIPDRLAGWGLASGAAFLAVALLWPAPSREPLRRAAAGACRALAERLRSDVIRALAAVPGVTVRDDAQAAADAAVDALHREFFASPNRPTGLSTTARAVVRLVDEVSWLNAIVVESAPRLDGAPGDPFACAVKSASANVLEQGADLLDMRGADGGPLQTALHELHRVLAQLEVAATERLAPGIDAKRPGEASADDVDAFVASLDPSFRAQELSFVTAQIASNVDLAAAAERRSWHQQLLGRQPIGFAGRLTAAQQRAGAHVERHSVWLHNSVRGGRGTCAGGSRRQAHRRPACLLGHVRHALGAALKRAQHRPERASWSRGDGRRPRRRRGSRDADRHQHDRALAVAPPRRSARRSGPGRGLVRRRPGGVHVDAVDPLQHPRAGRLDGSGSSGSRTWHLGAR
jgi:hypothetical protein